MTGVWNLQPYIFRGYHRLDLQDYLYKRVSKPGYSLRIVRYNLRNIGSEIIYVGNKTHSNGVELIARGCSLWSACEVVVESEEIVTLFTAQTGKVLIQVFYEHVPSNKLPLDIKITADDIRGKPVFPCNCDFYEVILKTGCQCGGT